SSKRPVNPLLLCKALQQHLQGAEQALEKEENLLSWTDEMGRSALMTGSLLGHSAAVGELVKQGASVNQHTARGYTALHLAACWGHCDTVQTLLKLGADSKAQNFRGEHTVDLAKKILTNKIYCFYAEAQQDLAHVKRVISESETSLNKEERVQQCFCHLGIAQNYLTKVHTIL
uniref:Ankyrin repeat domain-containing protein 45 n=1 Tax=Neogobius melanostomus TaxID=47308 RepID=A0A8C6TZH7_9GOBI